MEVTRGTRWAELPDQMQVHQIAAYLGVSRCWVYARVNDKTFTRSDMGTKIIFIAKEQLHPSRLMESRPRLEERRAKRILRSSDPDTALEAVRIEQKRRAEAAEEDVMEE